MWHSPFKLYLYPVNAIERTEELLDPANIIETLRKIDFIGAKLSQNRYATGSKFVSLLTFMGCSPNIELEPQEKTPFCYIELITEENMKFFAGINIKAASCPECKAKITTIDKPSDAFLYCDYCKKALKKSRLNWRKTAFIAQYCIAVGNIYESEAIPNDQLLSALETVSQPKWKYAYIREAEG